MRDRQRSRFGTEGAGTSAEAAAPVPGKSTGVPSVGGALPPQLRARLERALTADLSGVRVAVDPAVAAMGARAHARGTEIRFAPGAYDPDSPAGQQLIAHEVVHLLQQADGRVAADGAVGGVPVATDPALEQEADVAAARALAGEQVRPSGASPRDDDAAPIQGFFTVPGMLEQMLDPKQVPKYGNSFEPAPTNPAAANAAEARKEMRDDNELGSANYSPRDPRTGLLPSQEKAVAAFVDDAERYLAGWRAQRGTADLRFVDGEQMDNLYREFARMVKTDPTFPLAWLEASKRLRRGANAQFVREIRMFAPDMLSEYGKLLNVEDEEACHQYEVRAEWNRGEAITFWGAKIGASTRHVRIRYTNTKMPGLSWEQEVELTGMLMAINISEALLEGAKPKNADDKVRPKASGSTDAPGGWRMAANAPRAKYLGPDFFEGADYVRPTATATGKLGLGRAGAGASQLLLTKGIDKLRWDMPASVRIGAGMSVTPDGKGGASTSLTDSMKPGAELEAGVEVGTSATVGAVDFKAGEWDEEEDLEPVVDETWYPLHYAKLYFPTGEAELDAKDLATLEQLVTEIEKRDKKPGFSGQRFNIRVSGSHSRKWDEYDDELRALQAIPADERTTRQQSELEMYEILKEGENEALALDRATNTTDALWVKLGALRGKLAITTLAKSTMSEPTTHEPLSGDPYGNKRSERSVIVTVNYQLGKRPHE
jgi:hypothetical protein